MNNIFIKIFFLIVTLYFFLYCSSYARFQYVKEKKKLAGVTIFAFTLSCVILSNIVFWNS